MRPLDQNAMTPTEKALWLAVYAQAVTALRMAEPNLLPGASSASVAKACHIADQILLSTLTHGVGSYVDEVFDG